MKHRFEQALAAATLVLAVACGGGETPHTDGLPATDTNTTATMASDTSSTTTTASATTTAATGGTVSNVSPDDKEFVIAAGQVGMAEVALAQIAMQRAASADVKAFAQRMIADHGKSNEQLQAFVMARGLALPTELDSKHKGTADHLNGMEGPSFDRMYMQHMVEDHQTAVTLFQNGSSKAADPDLRNWMTTQLPVLQDHLKMAQSIQSKVK